VKNKKAHWYLFTVTECPVCGNGEEYKERKYTEKPKDKEDRYIYQQQYDNCMESLFF